MIRHFAIRTRAGETHYLTTETPDGQAMVAPGGFGPVAEIAEMPRALGTAETWNWPAGKIAVSGDQIDAVFRAAHGAHAIDVMHDRKVIEARRYTAAGGIGTGVEWSLLAAEAKRLKIKLADLVKQVLAHDDATIAAEVERRAMKMTAA